MSFRPIVTFESIPFAVKTGKSFHFRVMSRLEILDC